MDYLENDIKIYKNKIKSWQESYINELFSDYLAIMSGNESATDRFWNLIKRINEDRDTKPGVYVDDFDNFDYASMRYRLDVLYQTHVIDRNDLEGFSEDTRYRVFSMQQYLIKE